MLLQPGGRPHLPLEQHTSERILGYDARENWRRLDQAWSQERRERFLYRLDVVKPLSVDVRVWPTIFQAEDRPDPQDRFGLLTTWSELDALRGAVTHAYQEKPLLRAWRMIAITIVLGPYCETEAEIWNLPRPAVSPAQIGPSWTFLGFDVGDRWMLSALSNCGFVAGVDNVPALRAAYSPVLNQFHLFSKLDDAIEFKRFSDRRLAGDHAPCFVFGLWMIK